jgi:hypothetical protein
LSRLGRIGGARGFEFIGTGGGEAGLASSLGNSSCSLGGVLNGEIRSSSRSLRGIGARLSLICRIEFPGTLLPNIFGFPARFIGGGTEEAEEDARPGDSRSEGETFCGSDVNPAPEAGEKDGAWRLSSAGVPLRLGSLNPLLNPLVGEGGREVRGARKSSLDWRADMLGVEACAYCFGECGESTVIPGGDAWGERGPMLMGLNLGVFEPDMRAPFPL